MVDKTSEFPINFENKVLDITPDKQISHYFHVMPATELKAYPWKGRLDIVVKSIRGLLIQAIYVTVFGKTENEASVRLHDAVRELGLR